jgi:hypothetical protein
MADGFLTSDDNMGDLSIIEIIESFESLLTEHECNDIVADLWKNFESATEDKQVGILLEAAFTVSAKTSLPITTVLGCLCNKSLLSESMVRDSFLEAFGIINANAPKPSFE